VDAPGFDDLSADRKVFAYYLYRAAIAGNDILCAQNHRHALEVRRLAEEIFTHSRDVPDETRDALHEYLKLLWIHHGFYNHYSHTKFVPFSLTRDGFRAAVEIAAAGGASPVVAGETLSRTLSRLERTIFDPELEPDAGPDPDPALAPGLDSDPDRESDPDPDPEPDPAPSLPSPPEPFLVGAPE